MKALSLVLALALLPLAASAQLPTRCERAQGTSAYPTELTAGYNHDRFGTMPQDLFREFGAFVSTCERSRKTAPRAKLRLSLDADLTHKLQISLRCSRGDLRAPLSTPQLMGRAVMRQEKERQSYGGKR